MVKPRAVVRTEEQAITLRYPVQGKQLNTGHPFEVLLAFQKVSGNEHDRGRWEDDDVKLYAVLTCQRRAKQRASLYLAVSLAANPAHTQRTPAASRGELSKDECGCGSSSRSYAWPTGLHVHMPS